MPGGGREGARGGVGTGREGQEESGEGQAEEFGLGQYGSKEKGHNQM